MVEVDYGVRPRQVTNLTVTPEQEPYVANNAVSIAEAYFHREAWFRAVYLNDLPVGFVMLRDSTLLDAPKTDHELSLWRFMIDHRFQGSGLGRRALSLVIDHVRTRPRVKILHTSYVGGPHSPVEFYQSFGFRHTGMVKPSGEISMVFELSA